MAFSSQPAKLPSDFGFSSASSVSAGKESAPLSVDGSKVVKKRRSKGGKKRKTGVEKKQKRRKKRSSGVVKRKKKRTTAKRKGRKLPWTS